MEAKKYVLSAMTEAQDLVAINSDGIVTHMNIPATFFCHPGSLA